MKTYSRRIAATFLLLALLAGPAVLRAAESAINLKAFYTAEADRNRMVILIRFFDETDELINRVLDVKQGAPFDSRSYELTDEIGNPVQFQPVTDDLEPEFLASHVKLLPTGQLDPQKNYKLTVLPGKLVFLVGADGRTNVVKNTRTVFALEGGSFKENIDYFERERSGAGRSSIALMGGNAGGVASARVRFDKSRFLNASWVHLRLEGSADLALNPDDRADFFNNVSGELSFYSPLLIFTNHPGRARYSEIAVHAKTESDQRFDRTDALFGFKYAIYPGDPLTRWLGTFFVRTNTHVGALAIVGYDFVRNIDGDGTTSVVNTERANHRVTGILRWRIPVMEDFDFSFLPALGGRYDLDLDLELKGIYDVNGQEFLDQSRVSLAFTRNNDDRFKPSLVFTWARGKEGPTWEQVNALLAGLKLSF